MTTSAGARMSVPDRVTRRTLLKGLGASAALIGLASCGVGGSAKATPSPGSAKSSGATLTFTAGQRSQFPFNVLVYDEWQKRTGVNIDWKLVSTASITPKVQLMLGSGDTTDVLEYTRAGLLQQGPQACMALDDLIRRHMPNYNKFLQGLKSQVPSTRSSDGKMYGIWGQNQTVYMGWLYRKDLADKYGIGSLDTLNDWSAYLRAAKKDDPKVKGIGVYGDIMSVLFSTRGAFGIKGQMINGGYNNGPWMTKRNGKLVDASVLPEAKEAVSNLRMWFGDGLLDPDLVAGINGQQVRQKWLSGTVVAGIDDYLDQLALTDTYRSSHPGSQYALAATPPAKGSNGSRAETSNYTGWGYWGYGIGHNCKDPAAACQLLDYWYTDEGATLLWMGVEGKTFSKTGGSVKFLPDVYQQVEKDLKGSITEVVQATDALQYSYGIGDSFLASPNLPEPAKYTEAYTSGSQSIVAASDVEIRTKLRQYMSPIIITPQYTADEQKQMTQLSADIDTYRAETLTKMMIGQQPMSGWNAYVSQMKSLGTGKVESIINKAYDRANR